MISTKDFIILFWRHHLLEQKLGLDCCDFCEFTLMKEYSDWLTDLSTLRRNGWKLSLLFWQGCHFMVSLRQELELCNFSWGSLLVQRCWIFGNLYENYWKVIKLCNISTEWSVQARNFDWGLLILRDIFGVFWNTY